MYGKNFVICDQERQYAKQLLQIFSSRHAAGIQLYLFYTIEELQRFALQKKIHILLIAEEYSQKQREEIAAESKYVLLRENRDLPEGEQGIFRYQSAEAIWTRIVKSVSVKKQEPVIAGLKMRGKLIGIYSPVQRIGKTRFAISLGKKLAEKEPVLYLNLEAYSGEGVYFPEKPEGNLGDLLYYQRQEKDQLGIRISTIAGQLEKLDYIYPLSCLQDLKAVKKEDWITLFGRICKECIYGKVILDLSDCVDGLFEILECCDVVYTPYTEETISRAKLMQYTENLRKTGKENILEKTVQKKLNRTKDRKGAGGSRED